MELKDYTPANILSAMGLPDLAPRPLHGWALRVLLCPSFDPELCISFVDEGAGASTVAEVRVLESQLWLERRFDGPRRAHTCSAPVEQELALELRDCVVRPAVASRWATLDGMSFDAFLQMPARSLTREGHVSTDNDVREVLRQLLPALAAGCEDEHCVRALVSALGYVPKMAVGEPKQRFVATEPPAELRGGSPKRPKVFAKFSSDLKCPACLRVARSYRKLAERLVCLQCAQSFEVDQQLLSAARTHEEAPE